MLASLVDKSLVRRRTGDLGRGPVLDARDDPRVRSGAAPRGRRERRARPAARKADAGGRAQRGTRGRRPERGPEPRGGRRRAGRHAPGARLVPRPRRGTRPRAGGLPRGVSRRRGSGGGRQARGAVARETRRSRPRARAPARGRGAPGHERRASTGRATAKPRRLSCAGASHAFEALGDERRVASLEGRLAVHASYYGDTEDARARAEHVSKRATELGMPRLETQALSALASIAVREGDLDAARELFRRSAVVARGCGFTWWEAGTLVRAARPRAERREPRRRRARGPRRAPDRTVDRGTPRDAVRTRRSRPHRACERTHLERAGRLWGAVLAEMERAPPPQRDCARAGRTTPRNGATTLGSSTPWSSAEPRGSRPRSSLPSPTLRPSRRAGGSPTRTASCRRRGRARGRRARPGSSRQARA